MDHIFTDENFAREVVEASTIKPVLVDFYADWCGSCKLLMATIEKVSEEIGDKAVVGKANIEECEKIATEFGIMSVPTILIFKDGKAVENFIGLQSRDALLAAIKKYY